MRRLSAANRPRLAGGKCAHAACRSARSAAYGASHSRFPERNAFGGSSRAKKSEAQNSQAQRFAAQACFRSGIPFINRLHSRREITYMTQCGNNCRILCKRIYRCHRAVVYLRRALRGRAKSEQCPGLRKIRLSDRRLSGFCAAGRGVPGGCVGQARIGGADVLFCRRRPPASLGGARGDDGIIRRQ